MTKNDYPFMTTTRRSAIISGAAALAGCSTSVFHQGPADLLIKNGFIIDGANTTGWRGDVVIHGDAITGVGHYPGMSAQLTIDASDLVVCPGFINSLSWSTNTLFADPRCMSDVLQGVTTQIVGEGVSMGPLNDATRADLLANSYLKENDLTWSTLGGFLSDVEKHGLSPNIASFVGATTVRMLATGMEQRPVTTQELSTMKRLVQNAMNEGAIGLSSALIYPPADSADTTELSALASVAARSGGLYATHMRSEGEGILDAIDETIAIAAANNMPAEIFHLKLAGVENWDKTKAVIEKINNARAAGLAISASLYPYIAGSTSLAAIIPPWAWEGGFSALLDRLDTDDIRSKIIHEIELSKPGWESLYKLSGGGDGIQVLNIGDVIDKRFQGKRLSDIAVQLELSPVEAAITLIRKSRLPLQAAYFAMSEDNLRQILREPWVSICSDGGTPSTDAPFKGKSVHPRAFGAFARILSHYVREEEVLSLPEAIRRMTSLPARKFGLHRRGILREGNIADIAVFDPSRICDRATFETPSQYAEGVEHVFINGAQVVHNGAHTGALPGRSLRGAAAGGR